jgi:hypothetical protein
VAFANQRIAAIDDELQHLEASQTISSIPLESQLESLPWKEAASKKCDYVRGAPADLIEKVRARGGVKGKDHHFTASSTEPTLFRFKRGSIQ